jgi:Fe-S cluster assembly ATPase SufC
MLQIEDLQVKLGEKEILRHIDLEIKPGETIFFSDRMVRVKPVS